MTSVNNVGTTQYTQQPYTGYTAQQPQQTAGGAYAPQGYKADSYTQGYTQGVGSVAGTANTMMGLSSGVGSMANSLGGIFGTIINLITSILNTIANLIGKLVEGVIGLFGGGKKDKAQGAGDVQMNQQTMPLPNNQGMGVMTPAGTPVPPPPPGTDLNAAYGVVDGDLKGVQDPNQGIQIVNIHAMKARDYRDKAEQFAKEAEKEARAASYAAEQLQKAPGNTQKLAELQSHKTKAMDLLKTAQEYTKAVYDEALYAQAANDILGAKFGPSVTSKSAPQVADAWKNWIGGTVEKKFIFFKETIKPAPEVFMASMNAVNANIGRATQAISQMAPAR